jgi:hypothetical protein
VSLYPERTPAKGRLKQEDTTRGGRKKNETTSGKKFVIWFRIDFNTPPTSSEARVPDK